MFPNTMPLVNGPTAPAGASQGTAAAPATTSFTQAPSYLTPGLSPSQMRQASPYTQYQNATQDMQKQMQNMRLGGIGSMVAPQQPGAPMGQANQPGQPSQYGPFGQSPTQPPQGGGF